MDATKRKAIEAAGWKVGDAADFLGMSDEERQLLDTRVLFTTQSAHRFSGSPSNTASSR